MSAEETMMEAPARAGAGADHEQFDGPDSFDGDDDGRGAPGMGQSKSSRRRRRKRKGKGAEGADAAPGSGAVSPMPGEVIGSVQAGAAPAAMEGAATPANGGFRQNGASQNGSGQNGSGQNGNGQGRSFGAGQSGPNQPGGQTQQGQNAPGGTKRWKKKFRDRDRGGRPGENAGGFQGNGGGGFAGGGGSANGGFSGQSFAAQGSGQGSPGGYGQNGGGGFRGPDTHQPGNGGSFKRKGGFGKQRSGGGGGGSRGGFVGPMDHSYRPPNGNIFEPSPSTIDPHQGQSRGGGRNSYQSDSQPIDYSQGRAIPIKEGTPTKIFFFIEDLFFTAKISETARKLGVKIEFVKNEKEQIAALTAGEGDDWPGLIVFDLNNANAKPLTLIPKLKTKLKKHTSIIGFLSHLQGDLKAKAVEAGCDTVMPRAAFSQNLPNLLRRYGIEEAEEPNFNQ